MSRLPPVRDIPTPDAFCEAFLEKRPKQLGRLNEADREDVLQELRIALWQADRKYDPSRGQEFRSFATGELSHALVDYWRRRLGRFGTKVLDQAASLDVAPVAAISRTDAVDTNHPDDAVPAKLGSFEGALRRRRAEIAVELERLAAA